MAKKKKNTGNNKKKSKNIKKLKKFKIKDFWTKILVVITITASIVYGLDRIVKKDNNKNENIKQNITENIKKSIIETANSTTNNLTTVVSSTLSNVISNKSSDYKVLYVSDGDTIAVKQIKNNVVSGDLIKVRLFGIDAPETNQDYGYESKQILMNLIKDQNVKIVGKEKDKYGRLLGTVYIDEVNVNEEMVKGGHAWWYEQYDKNNTKLKEYQENAQKKKLGLFAKKGYIEPWKFRKNKSKNK